MKLGWDEIIPDSMLNQWKGWLDGLPMLRDIEIPRCFKPVELGSKCSVQLHHFSDASEFGYGVVSYLRFLDHDGQIYCSVVLGKSRVAPAKHLTIPRLELAAATLAVKLNAFISNEIQLKIDDTIFWTDSTIVLQYIRNTTSRFKTFVAN